MPSAAADAQPFVRGRNFEQEAIAEEGPDNSHGADHIFLFEADAHMPVANLVALLRVGLVVRPAEQTARPLLQGLLQACNLLFAARKDAERIRMKRDLGVEALGHLRKILFEARSEASAAGQHPPR